MNKMVTLRRGNAFKQTKLGFSWTTLLFGFFVPLFRGDLKYMLIMMLLAPFTLGLSAIFFPFTYNKFYIKDLISDGYVPATEEDEIKLNSRNIVWNREFMEDK